MSVAPLTWWYAAGINPVPWKSPTGSMVRRGGKLTVHMSASGVMDAYKEAVAESIRDQYNPTPTKDDLELFFWFSRQLLGNDKKADATNLQKSTEDSLHGLLFANDSQVRKVHSTILDQNKKAIPFIIIAHRAFEMDDQDQHAWGLIKEFRPDTQQARILSEHDTEAARFF